MRRPLVLACLVALAAGLTTANSSAGANGGTSPHSTVPSSGDTFASSQRALVQGADGTLYLAHLQRVDGFDQVVVSQSRDQGHSWARTDQVSSGPTRSTNRHLIVDRQGRPHLFWTKYVAEVADQEPVRQVFTSVYEGGAWSPQRQLTHDEYNGVPSATVDSTGRVHLVWYGFDGESYQIYHRSLNNGEWSDDRQISQGYPDSVNPVIAVDAQDNLHVTWYKFTRSSQSYQVVYRRYEAGDARWLPQRQLSQDLFLATDVSLTVARDGRVFAVYEGNPEPNQYGLYARVLQDGSWSPQATIVSPEHDARQPTVTVDTRGRAFVFYRDRSANAIHVIRHEAGQWQHDGRPIPRSESGMNPSARWGFWQAPVQDGLDVVWTERNAHPQGATGPNLIHFQRVPLP